MARKSAASMKAIKTEKTELPPIEETWDNIKQINLNIAEVSVVVAGRVENLCNIRAAAYSFWGNQFDNLTMSERMQFIKEMQGKTVATYENILEVVHSWELEEFLKEDMKDYFADLMPTCSQVNTERELFVANLIADIIKPWGEKMNQVHYQMLNEKAQREEPEVS